MIRVETIAEEASEQMASDGLFADYVRIASSIGARGPRFLEKRNRRRKSRTDRCIGTFKSARRRIGARLYESLFKRLRLDL